MSKRPWNKAQATKLAEALHVPVEEIEELEDALTETATATEEVATVDPAQARWIKRWRMPRQLIPSGLIVL